jgi:hypothetical protein
MAYFWRKSVLKIPVFAPQVSVHLPMVLEIAQAEVFRWHAGIVCKFFPVIDGEGQPPNDFMALREEALGRGIKRSIDPTVTRRVVSGAFPKPSVADKLWIKTCARCWLWCRRP